MDMSENENETGELVDNVHPGDVLREDFLKPEHISAYALAKAMDVPATRIQHILARRRGITADTAMRLARVFDTSVQLWLGLQNQYDIEQLERSHGSDYDGIHLLQSVLQPSPATSSLSSTPVSDSSSNVASNR
jgi:addiction module HigA family antidote